MKSFNLQQAQPVAFPAQYEILRSAVLSRTSLEANNNKFYVLEMHRAGDVYRLFTNYGRVGAGGIQEARYGNSLDDLEAEWERIYREKTSPRKGYVPVEIEKATVGSTGLKTETDQAFTAARGVKNTSLHADIARFVEHIYDESKSELIRRIETPLGSLSKAQIERGADTLRELRYAIARDHKDKIVPLTSRYFTLIPHRLGRWTNVDEVAVNTIEKADNEDELLQLMRDVYHVQNDLEAEVDRKYRALGAQMEVVSPDDPDFERVRAKILKTQSGRHYFKLNVGRIFRVAVPDERRRYETDGLAVGNVKELFHGSKVSNMVGILTRGLLIAPKNVPVTGYMFGKGIYFADQSSKSAQYALWSGRAQSPSYLFLADVALGRVKKEILSKYREEAPRGFHSVQGCAGVSLVHNEFIVYKTAQCTLRYIAEISQA